MAHVNYNLLIGVLFLSLLTFVAGPAAADHSVSHERSHGEWASLLINSESGPIARAIPGGSDEDFFDEPDDDDDAPYFRT